MTPEDSNRAQRFWEWFGEQSAILASLHSSGQTERLGSLVSEQLDKIESGLAWEIGQGKQTQNSFTISADGDRSLKLLAEQMIQDAPELEGWEFYASMRLGEPSSVLLPEQNLTFSTSAWEFSPIEVPAEGVVGLIVISDELASIELNVALRAVSLHLDALLGEDTVKEWLGWIEIKATLPSGEKKFPFKELGDYLMWATHRENNPLRKV